MPYGPEVTKRSRFEKKVERTEGCWEWRGYRAGGYGVLRSGSRPGRLELAHRLAWEFANGSIPEGLVVCHRCDNPGCVRPDHLFVGSLADNVHDMDAKARRGRYRGGEHHNAHFTDDDIRSIRSRVAAGETAVAIGREYGVSKVAIGHIVHRRNWKHVA